MRLKGCAAAARRRLAAEHGYSLSEMLVVLAIIGVVVTALSQLFVSASTAQVDMTRRFRAQQDMRLALDKLRREIHCANNVNGTLPTPSTPTSSLIISLGSYCLTNATGVLQTTWCTKDKAGNTPPGAGAPYSLWRYEAGTCSGPSGRKWADYLTTGQIFTDYTPPDTPPASGNLGTLSVNLPVDLTPNDANQRYRLADDIVLRNTSRS
jgi:prepilin-type N-terminal cleavage/methylation domain-containing protein